MPKTSTIITNKPKETATKLVLVSFGLFILKELSLVKEEKLIDNGPFSQAIFLIDFVEGVF